MVRIRARVGSGFCLTGRARVASPRVMVVSGLGLVFGFTLRLGQGHVHRCRSGVANTRLVIKGTARARLIIYNAGFRVMASWHHYGAMGPSGLWHHYGAMGPSGLWHHGIIMASWHHEIIMGPWDLQGHGIIMGPWGLQGYGGGAGLLATGQLSTACPHLTHLSAIRVRVRNTHT